MLRAMIAALCLALAAALLALLAQQRTRAGIDHAAGAEMAIWEGGHTPWDWSPRQPDDAIAGRAFGQARLQAATEGLGIDESDGQSFEIGVPLVRPLPLHVLPTLRLVTDSTQGALMELSLAETEGSDRTTSETLRIPAGSQSTLIDLQALHWHPSGHVHVAAMPTRATMLRLRLQLSAGATLTLRSLSWRTSQGNLPLPRQLPSIALPQGASAEALLGLRDRFHAHLPMVLVAASLPVEAKATWSSAPPIAWSLAIAWIFLLLALLVLRRRGRHGRMFALAEVTAAAAPPIAWAVGLQSIDQASGAAVLALVASMLYAVLIAWRSWPSTWHLTDAKPRTWLWALLPVLVAAVWAASTPVAPRWPPAGHVMTYVAWALLQQAVVLAVVATRLSPLIRSRFAVALMAALLFALMHTPNSILMLLCLVAECWWAWGFLRQRALLPIALAHALAALLLQSVLPGLPLRSMEIGARFFM